MKHIMCFINTAITHHLLVTLLNVYSRVTFLGLFAVVLMTIAAPLSL